MPSKVSRSNTVYGYPNPQLSAFPDPIVAQRAPTASDKAVVGQIWVDQVGQLSYIFIKNSAGNSVWVVQSNNGGAAAFTSLTVTGPITQTAGNVEIGRDNAAQTLYFGTGTAVKTVNIGSTNTTSATNINAGSNGITLLGTVVRASFPGSFRSTPLVVTPADAVIATTANGFIGSVRFNDVATFNAAPGALLPTFTITNAALTAGAAVLVTVQTENGTPANCMLRVAQVLVVPGAPGIMQVDVVNDAAAGGNSDCTLCIINFMVMV